MIKHFNDQANNTNVNKNPSIKSNEYRENVRKDVDAVQVASP